MADRFTPLCSCQCSVSLLLVVVGWSVVWHFLGILTCLSFYVLYMQSIYMDIWTFQFIFNFFDLPDLCLATHSSAGLTTISVSVSASMLTLSDCILEVLNGFKLLHT